MNNIAIINSITNMPNIDDDVKVADIQEPGNYVLEFSIDGRFSISAYNKFINGPEVIKKMLIKTNSSYNITSGRGSYKLLLKDTESGEVWVTLWDWFKGDPTEWKSISNIKLYKFEGDVD